MMTPVLKGKEKRKKKKPPSSEIIFQKWKSNKDFLKHKLKGFITRRSALQEILKEFFKENKSIQVRNSNLYKDQFPCMSYTFFMKTGHFT